MTRTALAAALLVLLAACGGGGADYADTKALADALGCPNHRLDGPDVIPLGAKETGNCDGYSLAVFRDDAARDTFVEGVGALGGSFAVGEGWAVGATSVEAAEKAAEKLGGKVV